MELRHLRYFAALAEHFNFTRAAEATHVVQSTLSHQIKVLEEEVGYALFDRSGRKVLLTEKGAILLPHVLRVLGEMDAGLRALSSTSTGLSGRVKLGAIVTVPFTLLSAALASFVSEHRKVSISLAELPGDVIEREVRSHSLDLGIVYRPKDLQDVWFEPVYRDELVFVVGHRHPLANRQRLRLAELHQQRIGVLSGVETKTMMDTYFHLVAAQPVIVAEVNKVPPLVGMVTSCDIGVLVPRRSAAVFPGVYAISLEYPTPVMELGLIFSATAELSLEAAKLAHLIRTGDTALPPTEPPPSM